VIGILKYQQQYGLSNHEAAGDVPVGRGFVAASVFVNQ
jgi:hypothetical protein